MIFNLIYKTEINKKPFEAKLQFRKSDNNGYVFL